MSPHRPPMDPPEIPGFQYQHLLGSGGYSDVFLYRQDLPKREVAIKVLVTEASDMVSRTAFTAEANVMAALSEHPYIVTIYQAGVSSSGHPFLVMELYPRPNLGLRSRSERLSVVDVLKTSIQIAGAVQAAHEAGILHRDVKPSNILTSRYDTPGLTDFGIAAVSSEEGSEAAGMSIPWSPPEVVCGDGRADRSSDVYSLGATTYTLLTGRSPFQLEGQQNRSVDLISRIERMEVPPTGRADVPASLDRLLRQTMAKSPGQRPSSASAYGRALQEIELELGLPVSHLVCGEQPVLDHRSRDADDPSADSTRLKPVVIESQSPATPRGRAERTAIPGEVDPRTVPRSSGAGGLIDGQGAALASTASVGLSGSPEAAGPHFSPAASVRPVDPPITAAPREPHPASAPPTPASRIRPTRAVLVAGGVLVVGLFVVNLIVGDPPEGGVSANEDAGPSTTPVVLQQGPPAPSAVTAVIEPDGSVRVSWDVQDAVDGDVFAVQARSGDRLGELTSDATAVLPPGSPLCVDVVMIRDSVPSRPTSSDGC